MNEIEQILERLKKAIRLFHEAEIEFVLIGGLAMRAHGAKNQTEDADFAYSSDNSNVEKLAAFLMTIRATGTTTARNWRFRDRLITLLPSFYTRVMGHPRNQRFLVSPATLQKVRFVNLETDLGKIGLMREIPGADSFEGLFERAVAKDLGGFAVPVASVEDIVAMKRLANRSKDQAHIAELLALQQRTETKSA